MPGADDEAKTVEDLIKKITAQQKQTAEMLKMLELQKKMEKQKLLLDLLRSVQDSQHDLARALARNTRA